MLPHQRVYRHTEGTDALFCSSPFFVVGQSGDVIQGDIIKFGKGDGMVKGNLTVTAFVERILLRCNVQQLRNSPLGDILIFPQIPKSLIVIQNIYLLRALKKEYHVYE